MTEYNQKLISDCKKGRRKAQNELFRLYKKRVFNISYRYARNSSEADDFFQESFIQIFKSLVRKEANIENLEAWIYRVCINTCIKIYRKEQKQRLEQFSDEVLSDDHIDIIDGLSAETLFNVIGQLPDGYRVVFNLYFIDGYKHEEIAETLGISASTSRSQLVRAKKMLIGELEKLGIYGYEAS